MLNFMKREKTLSPSNTDTVKESAPRTKKPGATKNYYAGIGFEPEVIAYLDDLAARMRMNRSWVLNTIVHEYAKLIEQKNLIPLSSRASREEIIRL